MCDVQEQWALIPRVCTRQTDRHAAAIRRGPVVRRVVLLRGGGGCGPHHYRLVNQSTKPTHTHTSHSQIYYINIIIIIIIIITILSLLSPSLYIMITSRLYCFANRLVDVSKSYYIIMRIFSVRSGPVPVRKLGGTDGLRTGHTQSELGPGAVGWRQARRPSGNRRHQRRLPDQQERWVSLRWYSDDWWGNTR